MLTRRSACLRASPSGADRRTTLARIIADAGYRGHNAPAPYDMRVYTSGQKRRMTPTIRRQMKRRSAVEPVIGHLKGEHRLGRNHLAHAAGDAINAVLAAAGYNFRRLLAWLRTPFCVRSSPSPTRSARPTTAARLTDPYFTDDAQSAITAPGLSPNP